MAALAPTGESCSPWRRHKVAGHRQPADLADAIVAQATGIHIVITQAGGAVTLDRQDDLIIVAGVDEAHTTGS